MRARRRAGRGADPVRLRRRRGRGTLRANHPAADPEHRSVSGVRGGVRGPGGAGGRTAAAEARGETVVEEDMAL